MNCIIPFTKDIKFKNSISDVASISLEHEQSVSNNIVLGNFIISGTYKQHELSVNTEDFTFTLPFDVSLTNEVEESTLSLSIDNFTYEILKPDTLKVDIDFILKADDKEVIREELFEDIPKEIDEIFSNENLDTLKDDRVEGLESEDKTDNENKLDETKQNMIMNFASNNNEDNFVTYKIHLVKDGETLESICKLYNKNESEILDYNASISIISGEKVLIPEDE